MCSLAAAQDFGWRKADGTPAADTESRKSVHGFAGWLLTTSDADWKAKWDTPEHVTPSFNEADKVRKGEKVSTLIFVVNPKVGDDGKVNVRCDLKVTRPNGTISIDHKDVECLAGELQGSPHNMRLSAPVLGFVGEPADPVGTWTVDVTLRDLPRAVSMDLHTSFELLAEAAPKAK